MPTQYLPWIIGAGVVLVVLYYKGYIGLGNGSIKLTNKCPECAAATSSSTSAHVCDCEKSKNKTRDLGVAYHKALYEEAMADVYERMAKSTEEAVRDKLSAPFSATGTAPPTVPPTIPPLTH